MIRQYDTTVRWRLYGEWKTKTYKSHPELRVRAVQVDREAKGILRRLSHNTIDSLAGPVAKLAHSSPCIFFGNAVNQIMAYDNLAGVVIQVLKYSTNMSFDVLVFVILDALANPNKERVKDDGVNTSDWLQSLSRTFSASTPLSHHKSFPSIHRSCLLHGNVVQEVQRGSYAGDQVCRSSVVQWANDGNHRVARVDLEDGWYRTFAQFVGRADQRYGRRSHSEDRSCGLKHPRCPLGSG